MNRSSDHSALAFATLVTCIGVWGCANWPWSSPTIAIANGEPITRAEFDRYYASGVPDDSGNIPVRHSRFDETTALESYIQHRILLQTARERGIEHHPFYVHEVRWFEEKQMVEALLFQIASERWEANSSRENAESSENRRASEIPSLARNPGFRDAYQRELRAAAAIVSRLPDRYEADSSPHAAPVAGLRDGEVAKINGEVIGEDEFVAWYEKSNPKERRDRGYAVSPTEALESMIAIRLFVQEADRRGLREDPAIRQAVAHFAEYKLIEALTLSVTEAEVTDQTVRHYYDEHPDQFADRPFRYRFLLVPSNLVNPVFERLRKQLDFDAIAADFSLHFETSDRCDDWEYRERIENPLFAQAIERLDEPGKKIGVQDGDGYAFIERMPAPPDPEPDPFEVVEEDLRRLLNCESEVFFKEVITNSADVVILDPSLDRVAVEDAQRRAKAEAAAQKARAECEQAKREGSTEACSEEREAEPEEDASRPPRSESEIREEASETARNACADFAVKVSRVTCQ